ncbi:MAG: PAS domain-containing sensor histidine kinase [Gammaproteobacteria bacterium]|nr:PAS domain-containing sensor histidine kinase [Gammaproteobacteria bacterium]
MSELSPTSPQSLPAEHHILGSLTTSIFVLDNALAIQYVNQAGETLARLSRQRIINLRPEAVFDSGEVIRKVCLRAAEVMGPVEVRELSAVPLADPGSSLDIDVTCVPLDDGGFVLEIRNIANRLRIKRDNEIASRSTVSRTIIRQLAHEIKNPLGGLRGAAQLLSRRLPRPDLTEYTDVIIHEADRLATLVDSMLGPNRPTHRNAINLHRVLDHVMKLVETEAPPGVQLIRDYDPSLPRLLLDEDQLTQAVLNLMRNSLQAVGEHGTICLRSRIETGFTIGEFRYSMVARIDVEDSGPGVPDELRDQIFFPLVTGRTGGTGLGLALAQDLVNRHGGVIKYRNNEFTCFSIYLPLDSDEPEL